MLLEDAVSGFLVDLGIKIGGGIVENKFDERGLKADLKAYINRQEKYNSICSIAEEIDFQGFVDYISKELLNDIEKGIFSLNQEERRKSTDHISIKASDFIGANTKESRERVAKLISDCLDIILNFYQEKIDKKELVLSQGIIDVITGNTKKIVEDENSRTQKIVQTSTDHILARIAELQSTHNSQLSATDRANLVRKLKESFSREIRLNPSMKHIDTAKDIFPNAHFEQFNTLVHATSPSNGRNTDSMPLLDALKLTWNNKEAFHVSLFGIGGLGKTTSLLSIDWPAPAIYIPLRYFTKDSTIDNYIQKTTLDLDSELYHSFSILCNEAWSKKPNIILILDGINEITDSTDRNAVLRDIAINWRIRKGVQLIVSSRYDVSSDMKSVNMLQLHLDRLTKTQIRNYLTSLSINTPKSSSRLWHVIDTPLMLNLYARNQLLKMKYGTDPDIELRENLNAGSIIWNYLQSEIYRCKVSLEDSCNIINTVIAAEFIAPYIAYKMQQSNGLFSISQGKMTEWIRDAYDSYQKHKKSGTLPQRLRRIEMTQGADLFAANKFYKLLTKNMCLFLEVEGNIQLMHQHFRDALAALYLYQLAETASESVPEEWKLPLDQYVGEFLSDLFQTKMEEAPSLWNKIWELFRAEHITRKKDKTDITFIKTMLQIYKASFGNDISKVNFSSVDLSEISLIGYRLTQASKDHFVNTIIGDETFGKNGHRMKICAVSWAPFGDQYISASHDCTILSWNAQTGESRKINIDNPHKRYIRCAQWCPSNKRLIASSGDDKQIILWELNGVHWIPNTIGEMDNWVQCLTWDPNSEDIVCADRNGNIVLYSNRKKHSFQHEHTSIVESLAFSRHNLFASGSDEGLVCIWNKEKKAPQLRLYFNSAVKSIQWAGKDTVLAVLTTSGIYFIDIQNLLKSEKQDWNMQTGQQILWQSHGRRIFSAAINTYNEIDYCALIYQKTIEIFKGAKDEDGNYQLYCISSRDINARDFGIISCAAWNQSCSQLILGSHNGSLWNATLLEDESTFDRILLKCISEGKNNSARCSAWNLNGTKLAVGYDDGMIRIWDIANKQCTNILEGHNDSVKCIAWAPAPFHNLVASGSDDGSIKLWDYSKMSTPLKSKSCSSPVNCIACLKNGNIIGGTDNRNLIIWDQKSDKSQLLEIHKGRIYCVIISKDENYAISGGNDKLLCVWKLNDDPSLITCVQTIASGHEEPIRGLAWSPQGNGLYSGSNDKLLSYRDFCPETGRLEENFSFIPREHTDFIYSVTLSGNGKYIVTGSTDTTLRFWDANKKKYLACGPDHSNFVWNVSASPKNYIASSSSDGTIKIWDVSKVEANTNLHALSSLEVLPGVYLVGCDFRGANIANKRLRELIHMNGGIVD